MNKHLHRIVFNAARGQRMAVQETARSAGKAASGTTVCVSTALAMLVAGPAVGQIAADPNAHGSQRPTVLATPGGAALVNIQTPSAAGVSRNLYRQFDVGPQGAVLNNSRTAAPTQLAGQVAGNPWLARGSARVILNEVNSADPSRLRGYVEVAGPRAEVVIANPSGIQVDGAGFINTSRATLTTGTPQFGVGGTLDGFLVRGGTIVVDGAGLDAASTDYVAILSRALRVNAGIWASELKAVAGTDGASGTAGAAPAFALDVSALGGMYAGKITLVGTGAGVGVRNAGHIGAGPGGLVVTAAGRLENSGTLEGGRVELASDEDIYNRGGRIHQAGTMGLQLAGTTVRNSAGGQIGTPPPPAAAGATNNTAAPAANAPAAAPDAAAVGDPTQQAISPASAPGSIAARGTLHNEGGRIDAAGTIALQARDIDNAGGALHIERLSFDGRHFGNAGGQLSVRGDFSASAERFDNTGGQLQAGRIAIVSRGDLDNRGGQIATTGANLALRAGTLANTDGRIEVAGNGRLSVDAEQFAGGNGTLQTGGALALRARDATHAGQLQAGQVTIEATRLHNSGQIVQTGADPMRLAASEALDNRGGSIMGHGVDMAVQTAHLSNHGGQIAHAGTGQLRIQAERLDGGVGTIASDANLSVQAGQLQQGGRLQAAGIEIAATRLDNRGGDIVQTGKAATRIAATALDNSGGRIATNAADVRIEAVTLDNRAGSIAHAGPGLLDLRADRLAGDGGHIASNGALHLQATELVHGAGATMSAEQITLEAGRLANAAGEIVQHGSQTMLIAAREDLDNRGGRIVGHGDSMALRAGHLANAGGSIAHTGSGALGITTGQLDGGDGRILGAGSLQLHGTQLTLAGSVQALQIAITAAALDNRGEIVQTGDASMQLSASGRLANQGGRIAANAQELQIRAGALDNTGGTIEHAGTGRLQIRADRLDGNGGRIVGNGLLQIEAQQIAHAQGASMTAEQIAVVATRLDNQAGEIVQRGAQAMTITASETLDNRGGRIAGNAVDMALQSAHIANDGGQVTHAGAGRLAIDAGRLEAGHGRISGNGALALQADTVANHGGVQAAQIRMATRILDNRGGQITQTGNQAMRLDATEALNNTGGSIAGNAQDMELRSASITNGAGHIEHAGNGQLAIRADALHGGDGSLVSNAALVLNAGQITHAGRMQADRIDIQGATLDNRGGQIVQTGTADMRIAVAAQLDNRGGRLAGNARGMDITAAALANAGGEITHAGTGHLAIAAEQLDAGDGRILGNGELRVQTRSLSHSGTMQADRIVIGAGTLANTGLIAQTGEATLQIRTTGTLDNRGGRIAGNGHGMALQAEQLTNAGGRIAHAGSGQLALTATRFDGGDGEVIGNGTLALQAASVHNAGRMHAARIAIDASDLVNSGEILQTGAGHATVAVGATLDNRAGLIGTATGSSADLTLSAAQVLNQGGRLQADGSLTLRAAADLHNTGGLLRGGNALDVALGGQLRNAGGALEATGSDASLTLQAAAIDNQDGRIVNTGNGASRIAAASIVNAGAAGLIGSNGALQLSAATLDNLAGAQLSAGQTLDLAVTDQVRNRGSIASDGGLTMAQANARLDNANGNIVAAGPVRIAVAQVQNDGGRIATATGSQADLTIATGSLSNLGGTLSSDRHLSLQLGGDHAHAGLAHAARDLALTVGGALRNGGLLRAGGTLAAQAQSMDNMAGASIEAGQVVLHAAGALHNRGEIGASTAALHADALTNRGTITADALSITARTLDNTGPQALLGATGDLALQATQALSNTDGANVYAGRDIRIATGALLNRSATLEAGRHIDVDAATVLNERPGVAVQRVVTLEENHTMRMPSWWQNLDRNGRGYTPEGTNYSAYQVSYINPADILEQGTVYTPDGYAIGRVVVRTHANDTVFFSGRAGRASGDGKHWGQAERMTGSDGTRVLYYTARQDGMPNPDQVPGVTSGVWEDALVHTMDTSRVTFNPAYGSCTTNCVRFVAPLDYTDPNTTIIRDTQSVLGPNTSLYELQRDAQVTATEDRLAPGAGTAGRIAAGGDIRVNFSGWMRNDHSDIVAGGALALHGTDGAAFENRATTLLRTWRFDGTHHYANGTSSAYRQPDRTEVIGSIGAAVSGQQVDIRAGSIRNVDTSAGSHANLTADLRLSSGTTPQAGTTRRIQNGMLTAQTGSGVSVQAQAVDQAAAGATLSRSEGATHGVAAQGASVTLTNGADITTRAQTSTGGGLFQLQPSATSATLYTTHPRFANAKPWVSSDSMLQNLGLDPALMLKRLGDGFMEQQRIREQVTAQTGRRHLAGYSDDDAQYAALLNAGASFAQALDLRVGVALTAAQMAQLTSDIVWLERQSVTLPDGSTPDVLAPRLYLAHLGEGTVRPHGALVTGDDVRLQGQDILNRGGVIGQASTGRTVLVASRDIVNQGGTVQGQDVALVAARDVRNESLAITQDWSASNERASVVGSHTSLSNTARIEAGRTLQIQAGQDVQDTAGQIAAGDTARVQAGRDIVFSTLDSGHDSRMQMGRASVTSSSRQAHAGQIGAGDDLVLSAGRDLHLNGAHARAGGDALLAAGRELGLQAVASTSSSDLRSDPAGSRYRQTHSQTTVQGASVQAAGDLVARAGLAETGNLRTVGSTLAAQGAATLSASGDVAITEARESRSIESFQRASRSGLLSRKTTVDETSHRSDTAVGSSVGGASVSIAAGRDLTVRASEVIADAGLRMTAGRDLRIEAGEDRFADSSLHQEKKSGLFGSGGLGITIGSQKMSGAQQSQSTRAVASTVGSVGADVTLVAGSHYHQTGSDVMAPDGAVTVAAQSIRIEEAREALAQQAQHKASGSGLTLALTSPVSGAIQSIAQTADAMGKTQSTRAKVLGAASIALDATRLVEPAKAVLQDPRSAATGFNLSISIGGSTSSSQSDYKSDTAHASSVLGRDVRLLAHGSGHASSIAVQGSDITASRDVALLADGAIDVVASRSTSAQRGSSKSSSASIGVSFGTNGLLVNVGASQGKGKSNGTELTYRNSHVSAGGQLGLQSGGDTTIAGGTLNGDVVRADIGGRLTIESLQDQALNESRNQSAGFSVSFGAGISSASVSMSKSKAHEDYASVVEQSGIHAGDGGFQLQVAGTTSLSGAVITSTPAASDAQRNVLQTAALTTRDIENHAIAEASSSGLSLSTDMLTQGKYGLAKGLMGNAMLNADASGSDKGVTRTAVSAGAVTITNTELQMKATGQSAEQAVAALNRQTDGAHQAAQRQSLQAVLGDAQAQQTLQQAAFKTVTIYTDDAYKTMFTKQVRYYRVTCGGTPSECLNEPDKRVVAEIDEKTAKREGTILAVNGILNDDKRAGQLAYQNASLNREESKPDSIVLMHIAPADTVLGELLVAGYEKTLASSLGYTIADLSYANLLEARGEQATISMGHSRGTIVQNNAFEILAERGYVSRGLSVEGVGIAVAAETYANAANRVIVNDTPDPRVSITYMANDPVSVIAAGNPGDALAALKEFYNVVMKSNSAHSCYGTGATRCTTIANPVAGGPVPRSSNTGQVRVYRGGQDSTSEMKP